MRSTKIVATLGPASDSCIESLVDAGVDVFRLNFSHGTHDEHASRIQAIRTAANLQKRYVAILADLQGPKIRICGFRDGSIRLTPGDRFCIDPAIAEKAGTVESVGTTYTSLAAEVSPGDSLVLGDGTPELEVTSIKGNAVHCETTVGGVLSDNKGINLKGGGLSAAALTDKDIDDLAFICAQDVDYVAISFVRHADDLIHARKLIQKAGGRCGLIAKLERAEAVACAENMDCVIAASDAVMVARGDLGIEIGDAALMGVQKKIIHRARELNRSVITATQMMESMVTNPYPTRAEVMDVANAVLDGTDAVMLSAETAVGQYPVETVQRMVDVIEGAEASMHQARPEAGTYACDAIDESVAMATMVVAENLRDVKAVISLTATGNTARLMSRSRSPLPIYALANNPETLARVSLFRGVHPRLFQSSEVDYEHINNAALNYLQETGILDRGDRVVLSKGDYRDVHGGTNTMKILEVA